MVEISFIDKQNLIFTTICKSFQIWNKTVAEFIILVRTPVDQGGRASFPTSCRVSG